VLLLVLLLLLVLVLVQMQDLNPPEETSSREDATGRVAVTRNKRCLRSSSLSNNSGVTYTSTSA
jgi:hypothetical protein